MIEFKYVFHFKDKNKGENRPTWHNVIARSLFVYFNPQNIVF